MGDAADDVYESEMRREAIDDAWFKGIRDACDYSILGRKPCRIVENTLPQEEREIRAALEADGEKLRQLTGEDHGPYFDDLAPYRCAYCGKEFDYP